jgi:hypothetical protein
MPDMSGQTFQPVGLYPLDVERLDRARLAHPDLSRAEIMRRGLALLVARIDPVAYPPGPIERSHQDKIAAAPVGTVATRREPGTKKAARGGAR